MAGFKGAKTSPSAGTGHIWGEIETPLLPVKNDLGVVFADFAVRKVFLAAFAALATRSTAFLRVLRGLGVPVVPPSFAFPATLAFLS